MVLGSLTAASAITVQAAAAASAPPTMPSLQEIVVTATKKGIAEKLQHVPLALSVFDEAAIEVRKVRDLQSLTYAVPGVSLDSVGTFRGTANFAIRGLGINSSIASVDPAVGTFVDGIYMGINAGVVLDLFDVERIEILRGPQGTLYGRNTPGGAVLIETADPSAQWRSKTRGYLEGPIDAGRGSPGVTLNSVLSGPLARGLAFRLGAHLSSDGGYFLNRFNGTAVGEARTTILRGGLSYERGPLRLLSKAEWLESDGDGAVGQNHGWFSRDSFELSLDNEGKIDVGSRFGVLRLDYNLSHGTITNIAGYRYLTQFTDNDIDSTPRFLFHSQTALRQEQVSNELRYAGTVGNLELTAGAYVFHQNVAYQEDRVFPVGAPHLGGGRQAHGTFGLFGESQVPLTKALAAILGLRWSRERKAVAVTYVRPRPLCSVLGGSCPTSGANPSLPAEPNGFEEVHSWENLAPKLSLQYRSGEDRLFYGSWTRGYRSGGFNVRVTQPLSFEAVAAARGTHSYDEERVDTFEIGAKLGGLNGRGTLNLSAYRSDVRDLQREVNVASASSGLAQSIFNTADARIWGGEAEARLLLGRTVVSANAGHIDARYRNVRFDISGDGVVGPADAALKLPRVPEWTFGGEIVHSFTLRTGSSLRLRAAYQHRDAYAWTDSNFGWVGASENVDADLTWSGERITISLYGRNLLDEAQFGGDTQLGFAGGPFSDGNNRPFDPRPAAGSFSPLAKGRVVGLEIGLLY